MVMPEKILRYCTRYGPVFDRRRVFLYDGFFHHRNLPGREPIKPVHQRVARRSVASISIKEEYSCLHFFRFLYAVHNRGRKRYIKIREVSFLQNP